MPMNWYGLPDEVAASVAFFATDDAAYVTGQRASGLARRKNAGRSLPSIQSPVPRSLLPRLAMAILQAVKMRSSVTGRFRKTGLCLLRSRAHGRLLFADGRRGSWCDEVRHLPAR